MAERDKELRLKVVGQADASVAETYAQIIKGYRAVRDESALPIIVQSRFEGDALAQAARDVRALSKEIAKPLVAHLEVAESTRFALPRRIAALRESAQKEVEQARAEHTIKSEILF